MTITISWMKILACAFIHSFIQIKTFPPNVCGVNQNALQNAKNVSCPCVKDAIWPLVWFICPQSFPLLSPLHSTYGLWWLPHDFYTFSTTHVVCLPPKFAWKTPFCTIPVSNFHTNFVVVQSCNWQFYVRRLLPRGVNFMCLKSSAITVWWLRL